MILLTKEWIRTILKTTLSKVSVVITAAGSSTRIGGGIKKEYLPLENGTVLSRCAKTFLNALVPFYNLVNFTVTYPEGKNQKEAEEALFCDSELKSMLEESKININFAEGGKSRQESVYKALLNVEQTGCDADFVLIHDGARPFVTETVIKNVVSAILEYGAAVPGLTPVDTQKEIDSDGFIVRHLVRSSLCAVQTPQGFDFKKILDAHKKAALDKTEYTDDTEIWGKYCGRVKVVEGSVRNIKITYPSDLDKIKQTAFEACK